MRQGLTEGERNERNETMRESAASHSSHSSHSLTLSFLYEKPSYSHQSLGRCRAQEGQFSDEFCGLPYCLLADILGVRQYAGCGVHLSVPGKLQPAYADRVGGRGLFQLLLLDTEIPHQTKKTRILHLQHFHHYCAECLAGECIPAQFHHAQRVFFLLGRHFYLSGGHDGIGGFYHGLQVHPAMARAEQLRY